MNVKIGSLLIFFLIVFAFNLAEEVKKDIASIRSYLGGLIGSLRRVLDFIVQYVTSLFGIIKDTVSRIIAVLRHYRMVNESQLANSS